MPEPSAARSFTIAGSRVHIFSEPSAARHQAAEMIAETTRRAVDQRDRAALGLATGGTPIGVYERLVALHRAGALSFRHVHTFNLDEYYPISPIDPMSYRYYMHRYLFSHVDLPANQAHVLDGTVPERAVADHCAAFEGWMAAAGGLDLQLLGIGRNGHIGFNEPSDAPVDEAIALPARLARLHPVTIEDAARDFGGDTDTVPRTALTLGTRNILAARAVLILAFGPAKAEAVAAALQGPITSAWPATFLRTIADRVTWVLDAPAAARLTLD